MLQQWAKAKAVRRDKCAAFAMGQHGRLGAGSWVQKLDSGVVRLVLDEVVEEPEVQGQLFFFQEAFLQELQVPSPLGPVDPSFRALSGRLKFMVRRHKFDKDSLCRC